MGHLPYDLHAYYPAPAVHPAEPLAALAEERAPWLSRLVVTGTFVANYLSVKFRRLIRFPRMMLWAFVLESIETKQMLHTFVRHGRGRLLVRTTARQPTEAEMKQAVEQLKDLPRLLPFFVFVVAPVPGVTEGYTLVAITLEKWLGHKVSLLPSQFRKVFQPQEEK